MNRLFSLPLLGVAAMLMPIAADAHHSAAPYDFTKDVTVTGTVSAFRYTNPHMMITVQTKDGPWQIEGGSPNQLSRKGWNRMAIKVGDKVVIKAHPLRAGGNGAFLATVTMADGHVIEG